MTMLWFLMGAVITYGLQQCLLRSPYTFGNNMPSVVQPKIRMQWRAHSQPTGTCE